MVLEGFQLVQKEDVVNFHFPETEVLRKESEIKALNGKLKRAIALGNLEAPKGENILCRRPRLQVRRDYNMGTNRSRNCFEEECGYSYSSFEDVGDMKALFYLRFHQTKQFD